MARFKVVTHQLQGASFGVSGGGYKLELEALAPIDAAIVEFQPLQRTSSSKPHMMPMPSCQRRAHQQVHYRQPETMQSDCARQRWSGFRGRGCGDGAAHPGHQCAGHVYRRSGRPCDDADSGHIPSSDHHDKFGPRRALARRPAVVVPVPAPYGPDPGVYLFWACSASDCGACRLFGVHMLAYDPYIEELVITQYGVEPVGFAELLQRSDIVSMQPRPRPMLTI